MYHGFTHTLAQGTFLFLGLSFTFLIVLAPAQTFAASGVDNNVVLLLHGNGTDASTTFTDSSIYNPKTVTPSGNAQIDTAQSKFGGASMLFDGSGDYVSILDSPELEPLGNNFTIDFWFRAGSVASGNLFVKRTASGTYTPFSVFFKSSGVLGLYSSSHQDIGWDIASNRTIASGISANTWYHFAMVRNGTSITTYIDGTQTDTFTTSLSPVNNAESFLLGGDAATGTYYTGHVDEFRYSVGTARWTSNFTPPTEEYGAANATNRYDIENSLQFNSASSRSLSKNFWAVGSTTKWTFSAWVKRDSIASTGVFHTFFAAGVDTNNRTELKFEQGNKIQLLTNYTSGSVVGQKITTATYTSTSTWYHVVAAVDTSQATAANRNRIYVNGTEVTSFSTDTNITQNAATWAADNNNNSGSNVTHYVGRGVINEFFDGLIADAIFVDGQQLTPSAFGYDDGGTWQPKDFAATSTTANNPYGTNGFRLDFSDRSNLGKDRSGRGNNFTLNNIGPAQQSTTTPAVYSRGSATSTNPSGELFITGDVFFATSTSITYNLSKGAGSFVIDHVLDPLNKLLYHSFVESPDMKNIYTGVTELDAGGSATIELPSYFLALNKDFRYLGSPMGGAMPNLHVSKEVRRKWFFWGTPVFKISGGAPNGKISWQITGIRQDPYAKKNPIRTEVEKGPDEMVDKGEYLHPELYNAQ